MNLTCHKCRHQWDEEVPVGQPVVMCPACVELVPMVLATGQVQAQSPPAPRPAPPKRPPAAEARPDRTSVDPSLRKMTGPPQPATRTSPTGTVIAGVKTKPVAPGGTLVNPLDASDSGRPPTPPPGEQSRPAAPTPPSARRSPSAALSSLIGRNLDGYTIEKPLGAGGMGAVFLARQVSLERDVALKVLAPNLASNADFLARFTREALSAAQLNHHNIIQVFDVGSQDDIHYITMEYVRGDSLRQIIQRDGRLRVDDAAAYVLQAARGLKYAHEQGIVHRDIKPDNLMLNEHGVIKIADLGLAKRVGVVEKAPSGASGAGPAAAGDGSLTQADVAMGTPAYIAPEQARDAGSAGAHADQYSLGCTLYYLCAGRTPHSGTTAFELISKHLHEPITPLDMLINGVPPSLNVILNRMLEKDPIDRFGNMGEVVRVLESYLGVDSDKGPYTPREHHLAVLEQAQREYYAAPALRKRRLAASGFLALMLLSMLAALLGGGFALAGGLLGLFVLTPLAAFLIDGIRSKTYLFRRVRAVFFGMPLASWAKTVGSAAVGLVVLLVLGWLWWWLAFAALAAGLAFAYRRLVIRPLCEERTGPVERMQAMLKELRVRGVSEETLHDFVCRFSGAHWEEFFEEFFGYEAMVLARGKWARADTLKPRKTHATWREPLVRWLEAIEQGRQEARNRKTLAKAEARRLKAHGVDDKKAEEQAKLAATKIMQQGLFAATARNEQRRQKVDHYYEGTRPKGRGRSPVRMSFVAARAALGLAMLAAGGVRVAESMGLPAPAFVGSLFEKVGYYDWGMGGTAFGLAAGALLLLTLLTRAVPASALIVLGALLLAGMHPLIELAAQPMLTPTTAFLGALGLAVAGLALMFFGSKR